MATPSEPQKIVIWSIISEEFAPQKQNVSSSCPKGEKKEAYGGVTDKKKKSLASQ